MNTIHRNHHHKVTKTTSKFSLILVQINQALNNPALLLFVSDELKVNTQIWCTLTLIEKLQEKYYVEKERFLRKTKVVSL